MAGLFFAAIFTGAKLAAFDQAAVFLTEDGGHSPG
jgi:hypothetical protein